MLSFIGTMPYAMLSFTAIRATLKLLIDTKSHKILIAEVSEEVVDFFFSLLSLHVGRLLPEDGMVGCLGKLYEGLENLSYTYLQPNLKKKSMFNFHELCTRYYAISTPVNYVALTQAPSSTVETATSSEGGYVKGVGLKPLKASLESNTVLTDVFLRKRKA
ncbi:hypothetical protein PRUPE_2G228300 [Prunus persica]|uniref:Uncharacterized protein n=1 Tax=Prunus persica TaxID=3760 RepID=M5X333_PRUPE|nr:hypothetical protein PRUPE_2G228300 [Prunus persica]